ncbi:MAG TPA: diaminopimelate epimerase [Actinomycetota bacterium]
MRFAKYHGTGNDFVMVEDLEDALRLDPGAIAALCDRHRGVGADGLIRIAPADQADFFMDYHNATGEVAEMCGNGIRCLAKYVYDRGLTSAREIDVLTRAGLKHLVISADDGVASEVTVDMGPPALERKALPMAGDPAGRFVGQPFDVDGRSYTGTAVSMGNPHLVLFLEPGDDLATIDVRRLGPMVEHRPEFPNRTNVEFVRVEDNTVHLRVWERGSGETMACGTGACASLVACALAGLTGREAPVEFPGGRLTVAWREDDHVFLTGPATFVFEGDVDPAWLAGASPGAVVGWP